MIIFLFISIGFIREKAPEVVGSQDYVLNYLTLTDSKENEIDEKLEQEFSNEEKKEWQLEIIPNENLADIDLASEELDIFKSNVGLSYHLGLNIKRKLSQHW